MSGSIFAAIRCARAYPTAAVQILIRYRPLITPIVVVDPALPLTFRVRCVRIALRTAVQKGKAEGGCVLGLAGRRPKVQGAEKAG